MKCYLPFRLLLVVLCFSCTQLSAQTIDIEVSIEDDYLNIPLSGVKVSVLNPDSTVVVDSATSILYKDRNGKLLKVIYEAPVKAEKRNYLLRATKTGYGDVWQSVSVLFTEVNAVEAPTIRMRKEFNKTMSEVVVMATKIKMYHKGDTLVFNADAFKLPDGSMLDALIRQLPGVTMNEAGEIFVNGRKVDELLLGSRSFMRGNKKVLMENLPYYTVKDLKVYEKQTSRSEALGYDVDPRKFVMDVNLKSEYSQGYMANAEVAGGTRERWLGRVFLLGFTEQWRYSLVGNTNNVNESRHIGERGHWTPSSMPQSLLTTHSVAADLDYQSKNKKLNNNFNADFTSKGTESEMRRRYEQFIDGSSPISTTTNYSETNNWQLKLHNRLELKKPAFFSFDTRFDYEKWDGSGLSQLEQLDDSLTASMRTNTLSKGRSCVISQMIGGAFNLNRERQWRTTYSLFFMHSNNRSWLSNSYDTWQASTQSNDIRHNAGDVSSKMTSLLLNAYLTIPEIFAKINLIVGDEWQYSNSRVSDFLYHPDTLLLASQIDMLTAITDHNNSYDSHHRQWTNTVSIAASKQSSYKVGHIKALYDQWKIGIKLPVFHRALDYKRGDIDTLAHGTWVYVTPHAAFRYMSPDGKRNLSISAEYTETPVDLLDRMTYRDDRNPLVVKLGNPDLQGRSTTTAKADYIQKSGKRIRLWHVGATFNYHHRNVAQSVVYDPNTGVNTYKPKNVSGAYSGTLKLDISGDIGEKRYWSWQMNADANYDHSVDHAMMAGETKSSENTVNTVVLHNRAYVQYLKDAFNIRATADIRWRHSEGRMLNFDVLNALDFNYGLSARYTIPRVKTTLSADATVYSRRGYGSEELNTDDFVLNASVSQPFLKGKLIARVEAFDLLHQLSSTQYEVNAQGRTETWHRSLPNYVMFHLQWMFNKNPKKR